MQSTRHPSRRPARGLLLAALALAGPALAGCTLIDQKTFAPDPEAPGPRQISEAAMPDRRAPLLTIRYDVPNPSYEGPLRYAVQAAQGRDAAIDFDVVAVVPGPAGRRAWARPPRPGGTTRPG